MALIPDEDTAAQREHLVATRADLAAALTHLAVESKAASKTCASKRGSSNLDAVYSAVLAVRRAEEAVDLAALDLASASGQDV